MIKSKFKCRLGKIRWNTWWMHTSHGITTAPLLRHQMMNQTLGRFVSSKCLVCFLSIPQAWLLPQCEECRRPNFVHLPGGRTINETLVRYGYIGCSPEFVSTAVSFPVLAAYRQFHRVCPYFSAHGFVKSLCHIHKVKWLCPRVCADSLIHIGTVSSTSH
jgi:hypothetical protein